VSALRFATARVPRLHREGALAVLAAVAIGLCLGGLAIGYQLRHKTTTELAIGAVAVALLCVIWGNPRRMLLAAVAFDIPLEWGKYLSYNTTLANVGEITGVQITISTLSVAGLYVLWAFDRRARGGAAYRPRLMPAWPLIAYVAINALSLLAATNRTLGSYELVLLAQTLLLYIYVVSTARTRTDVEFIALALLAGMALESLLIMLTYATGWSPSFLGLKNRSDAGEFSGRAGGTVGSPNSAAAYLCLMVPLGIGVLVSSAGGWLRRVALAAVPLGIIALLATESRGGWISFAISVAIIGIWAIRRGLLSARTATVLAVGAAALVIAFWGPITQRIAGNDNGSASSRISMIKLASKMIEAHPVLGLGVNNVGINIPVYAGPQFDGQWLYTIHDKYLLVWAEAGIFALIAFLWFLGVTLRRGWRSIRAGDPLLSPIALGLTAGVVGQLVHMGVDTFQAQAQVEGLWLVAALIAAIHLMTRRQRAQSR
jgi:O-antigen ligase